MANSAQFSIFGIPLELSLRLLDEVAGGDSAELLKYRLVSKEWKGSTDELIRTFWTRLQTEDPKGVVNIALEMEVIEDNDTPTILKFAKLMDVFKRHGSPIPDHSTVSVMVQEIHKRQEEYDTALKAIWRPLRKTPMLSSTPELPAADASPAEIRIFLNRHEEMLETLPIPLLDLKGLGLTVLPPRDAIIERRANS